MSYAQDNDDIEQSEQGESFGRPDSDYIKMCNYFGLTKDEFAMQSSNDQQQMRWNWKTFGANK